MLNLRSSFLSLILLLFAQPTFAQGFTTDLNVRVDGLLRQVGEVQVSNDNQNLFVRFLITRFNANDPSDNWCLSKTRLSVKLRLSQIPQENGSALPEDFEYQQTHDCVSEYTYTIPFSNPAGRRFFISANADIMRLGGFDGLDRQLPTSGKMTISNSTNEPNPDYFDIHIFDDTFLDGTYPGWCVDFERTITTGVTYDVKFYLSYGSEIPAGLIDHPEHLDRVNWILNQDYVGKNSPGGFGTYTFGDVQIAIWTMIDDDNDPDETTDPSSPDRVNEIVSAAMASGHGFRPACGQKVGVIVAPTAPDGTESQTSLGTTTLIDLKVPCDPLVADGWGQGRRFPCLKVKGGTCGDDSEYFQFIGEL